MNVHTIQIPFEIIESHLGSILWVSLDTCTAVATTLPLLGHRAILATIMYSDSDEACMPTSLAPGYSACKQQLDRTRKYGCSTHATLRRRVFVLTRGLQGKPTRDAVDLYEENRDLGKAFHPSSRPLLPCKKEGTR